MTTKKKSGQPPFAPTDRQRGMVAGMALWNVPNEEIRLHILSAYGKPISINTLKKAFKKELEEAFTNVETNIATAMYKRALKENGHKDGAFILKCKFGWSEEARPPDEVWRIVGGLPDISSPYPGEQEEPSAIVPDGDDHADD